MKSVLFFFCTFITFKKVLRKSQWIVYFSFLYKFHADPVSGRCCEGLFHLRRSILFVEKDYDFSVWAVWRKNIPYVFPRACCTPPTFACGTTTAGSRCAFRRLRWSELGAVGACSPWVWEFRVGCRGIVSFFWIFQQVLSTVKTVLNCSALVVEEKSVNHWDALLAQISDLRILEVVRPAGPREIQWCACLVLVPVLDHLFLASFALGIYKFGSTWNHLF